MSTLGPNEHSIKEKTGHLFIISAPSGGGKTTLCKEILDRFSDIRYSVSHTTRKCREGERDGIDYHFITKHQFKKKIKSNQWAEWAEVHGNFYGTSSEFIEKELASGYDILLDIDIQGAFQISDRYPESVTIFIMPPSMDVLKHRLNTRGTDNEQEINKRLVNAEKEIIKKDRYDHVIINDQLSTAVDELATLIEKYRSNPKHSNGSQM